jgi:hypothetical protein
MRPARRRVSDPSSRRLGSNPRNHRPILAAHAATSVDTCSTTSGVANPNEATSSAAYTTSRDTQTAIASRTSIRTAAIRNPVPLG